MSQPAFIWDLDGTLLDSYEVIVSSLVKTYKEFDIELNKEDVLKEVITESVSSFIAKMGEQHGISFDVMKERYSEISYEEKARIKPILHAKEILSFLKENGAKNYVFTHRGSSTKEVLSRLELLDYFDDIITGKDGFPRKPEPDAIDYLIDKHNLDRNTTYYVGDRTIDIDCADNAGIKSIMFLPKYSVAKASGKESFVVRDLIDIGRIFEVEKLIGEFVERAQGILKENLVGVYLHGSAVMGCFNPNKSDLDFIVVVNKKMTDDVKKAFMDMVVELDAKGPAKGIEMSIVTKDVCNPFVYPTPFELHFSKMHIGWYQDNPDDYIKKMNGTDRDLAAHFTIIGKRGKCLCGQQIEDIFGQVPESNYMDSIWDDIAEVKEDIESNSMYIILNLTRVLAYRKEGLVLSKKEGGEWGIKNLPAKYHTLILSALQEYIDNIDASYDMNLAKNYAEYMLEMIGYKN